MRVYELFLMFLICLFLVSLAYAVIGTAYQARESVIESREKIEKRHRPTECEQYYNDGTSQWQDCMGVGVKE